MKICCSTGGGLKKAGWFFLEHSAADESFILHNVDVLSTIDLRCMMRVHHEKKPWRHWLRNNGTVRGYCFLTRIVGSAAGALGGIWNLKLSVLRRICGHWLSAVST